MPIVFEDVAEMVRRRVLLSYRNRTFRLTSDREDLADRVLERAWIKNRDGRFVGDAPEQFVRWTLTIASRAYVDYVRSQLRGGSFPTSLDQLILPSGEGETYLQRIAAAGDVEGDLVELEEAYDRRDALGAALAIIRRMPYHQRLAVLAHYAGKTDKEIDPSDNGFLRVMRYRALQQIRREVGLVERKPGKQELLRAQVAEANRAAAA